ncbi:MAG: hypothetical protein EPO26_05580 [Chloroflexota bacterium]|nr:MAG: hypothetical protein EPO26_05580 [Chloroflexota bacterium]
MARILRGARVHPEGVVIGDGVPRDEFDGALGADDATSREASWWNPTALPVWSQAGESVKPAFGEDERPSEIAELERAAFERIEEADRRLAEAEAMLVASQTEVERVLGDARRAAANLISDAEARSSALREEAAALRDKAETETEEAQRAAEESGRSSGYETGFAEGREAGLVAGQLAADETSRERVGIISDLAATAALDRRELLRHAEADLVRLAIEIARRILNREVSIRPDTVRSVAEAALRLVSANGGIRLRVHPDDIEPLSEYWSEAHASADGDRSYEFVPDAEVERGGVIIETRAGTVDARLMTQIDEVARDLLDSEPPPSRGV